MAKTVELKRIVEKMNLKNLTPDVELNDKEVEVPDINRPALQLSGYFEHFDSERVQIIGYVEYTFLEKLDMERKRKSIRRCCLIRFPVSYSAVIFRRSRCCLIWLWRRMCRSLLQRRRLPHLRQRSFAG